MRRFNRRVNANADTHKLAKQHNLTPNCTEKSLNFHRDTTKCY